MNINKQISLTTLDIDDAAVILTLVNNNRENLRRYLYWVDEVKCLNSARKYIRSRISSGLYGARWYKVHFNGNECGIFAVKSICQQSNVAELGYWLAHDVQGNGIIGQILICLPRLLPTASVNAIEFRCLAQNLASIAIARKAGGKLVDRINNYLSLDGTHQDLLIYQAPLVVN